MSSITKYDGKTLEKQHFVMEESYFVNCVLKDCDLFYAGGDYDWLNVTFENCRWHWRGPAGKMFQLATAMGMLKTSGIPPQTPASSTKMMN